MAADYLRCIEKFLGEFREMRPEPTGLKASFSEDPSIKAVIFDIYGTIIISASGDVDESEITMENLKRAMEMSGLRITENHYSRQEILSDMLESFRKAIDRVHCNHRSNAKPYPEVDILQIWNKIITSFQRKKCIQFKGEICIQCFTFIFEMLSNKVYPMPGMKEVVTGLHNKGIPVGIISNAQFYTPLILNYFMHGTLTESEIVPPFQPDLTIFSYRYLRAKPDVYLFNMVKQKCYDKYRICPEQILFLGNDMFRDVYPARLAGFKTVLFAGDTKSLRLREEKSEVNQLVPDYVITDLYQMLKIVP